MRNNRLFSLIVVIGAMALAIALTINAGGAAPQIVSSDEAPSPSSALEAGIAGAAVNQIAPIDGALLVNRHDPRSSVASDAVMAFDVEQARSSGRADASGASGQDDAGRSGSSNKSQNSASNMLDQRTRDAIQARWLAQYGGTNRTCVLLCGGW